jgi:16S rRNA G1207 methylase RsmC
LRAKCGEQERVIEGDFVEWAKTSADRFDVVVMNPPFDQGRWMLHLKTAVQMLNPDGLLVAVLPMSAANKPDLLGDGWWQCSTEAVFDNEFDGTSISVCVVKIRAVL